MQSNTSVSIPYSYRLDGANCVPNIVSQTAGADKGLRVSDGNCSPQNPPAAEQPGRLPTARRHARPPGGVNLSLGADSDGSSKASGTSYGNVRDGDLTTYWSPVGTTGRISIKWGSATAVSTIISGKPRVPRADRLLAGPQPRHRRRARIG